MEDKTIMKENIQEIRDDIIHLRAELAEREAALPAHSVKPHHLLVIEELEEEISMKQEILDALENAGKK